VRGAHGDTTLWVLEDGPSQGVSISIGTTVDGGRDVRLSFDALRQGVVVFAGADGGKAVLVRRIVEECALQGVSAIVLDPDGTYARLGDRWPDPPDAWWGPGDAERAAEYLTHTDVVIWTPQLWAGRPLDLPPLPDFDAVKDEPAEFDAAVYAAATSIMHWAEPHGNPRTGHDEALLRDVIRHYGSRGGRDLDGLIGLLSSFPEGVSDRPDPRQSAARLADVVRELSLDPLFRIDREFVDPGELLTPSPGKRARVSVVSLAGLPSVTERQIYLYQLAMALFTWVRRQPAVDRQLAGLLAVPEADTLVPADPWIASTASIPALLSQARKYGLGLVFASNSPGETSAAVETAGTQIYGMLWEPADVAAARHQAGARGGAVRDLSALPAGQFYVEVGRGDFERTKVPLCLSYHPGVPLPVPEIINRALRGSR
jgi:hypothetical protein